jgi:predicted ester cyclase
MADNKELIRRLFDEVVNNGKLDVVEDLMSPDFSTVTPMGVLNREGFKGFVTGWRGAFPDIHCEVSDLIAEGDTVAWAVRARGTHEGEFNGMPATGRSVDFDSLNIAHARDGQLVDHRVLMDFATMMAQLGVPTAP